MRNGGTASSHWITLISMAVFYSPVIAVLVKAAADILETVWKIIRLAAAG